MTWPMAFVIVGVALSVALLFGFVCGAIEIRIGGRP